MMSSAAIPQGPYRATKLWNEVVRLFEVGMPTKKHRHLLKSHNDCFTAFDAVEWLHALLKVNRNFGTHVSRNQTIQLLNKFLKNHVIEDVQGNFGQENFFDNGQLYRFPLGNSPVKPSRRPFAQLQSNINLQPKTNLNKSKLYKSTPNIKNQLLCDDLNTRNNKLTPILMTTQKEPAKMSEAEIQQIWKSTLQVHLKRVLHLKDVDDITLKAELRGDWIMHNVIDVGPSGVVMTSSDDEMPCWILSAMKCLSSWPNSSDSGLPCYEGFEKDVFKAIVGYFQALPEPLIPFNLYEIFTTVLVRCELLDQMCTGHKHTVAIEDATAHKQTCSEMDRIHKQLMQAQMRHENIAVRRQRSTRQHNRRQLFKDEGQMLCPRHASEANNNPSSRAYQLQDKAPRNTWIDRFQSVQALDVLAEENSFATNRCDSTLTRHENVHSDSNHSMNACSLPELRDCEDRGSVNQSDDYVNLRFQQSSCRSRTSLTSEDWDTAGSSVDKDVFSSVEDLLLDMSLTTRTELEMDLMRDDINDNAKNVDTNEEFRPPSFSPAYMQMKPATYAMGKVEKFKKLAQRHSSLHELNNSRHFHEQSYLTSQNGNRKQMSTADPYLTMLPQTQLPDMQIAETEFDGNKSAFHAYHKMAGKVPTNHVDNYASLPRPRKSIPKVVQRASSANQSKHRQSWCGNEISRSKSDIVARREVPPPMKRNDNIKDVNEIKSRIMRLPYVSVSTMNSTLEGQLKLEKQCNFKRLSRSYSSLCSHPRPRLNAMDPTDKSHHKSMRLLHHNAKSTPSEPQSPLSAALDLARRQLNISGSNGNERTHTCEAFQLCLLLLPPADRRKLHLLLCLMSKMVSNPHLISFDGRMSTRSLVIEKFSACIIRSHDHPGVISKKLSERVVCFLLNHASLVMTVHEQLKRDVEEKKMETLNEKANPSTAEKTSNNLNRKMKKQYTFCKQVSSAEYEDHSGSTLHNALSDLLHAIIADENISAKEKKKKLKQFQKSYPDIYQAQFPLGEPPLLSTNQKKQPLFGGAFRRLKNLRL